MKDYKYLVYKRLSLLTGLQSFDDSILNENTAIEREVKFLKLTLKMLK